MGFRTRFWLSHLNFVFTTSQPLHGGYGLTIHKCNQQDENVQKSLKFIMMPYRLFFQKSNNNLILFELGIYIFFTCYEYASADYFGSCFEFYGWAISFGSKVENKIFWGPWFTKIRNAIGEFRKRVLITYTDKISNSLS